VCKNKLTSFHFHFQLLNAQIEQLNDNLLSEKRQSFTCHFINKMKMKVKNKTKPDQRKLHFCISAWDNVENYFNVFVHFTFQYTITVIIVVEFLKLVLYFHEHYFYTL